MRFVEARLTLLSSEEGGRTVPILLSAKSYYAPHIVLGATDQQGATRSDRAAAEEYLGVIFPREDRQLALGATHQLELGLLYEESGVDYAGLVTGASFTLREGATIIGYGEITRGVENAA